MAESTNIWIYTTSLLVVEISAHSAFGGGRCAVDCEVMHSDWLNCQCHIRLEKIFKFYILEELARKDFSLYFDKFNILLSQLDARPSHVPPI